MGPNRSMILLYSLNASVEDKECVAYLRLKEGLL
jgi:hypothetical protein